MNADDLLDYQLGQLDDSRRDLLERALASDPELARRSDRLSNSLHQLLDDGLDADLEPSAGLADRTVALVQERRDRPRILEFAPARVPFKWADVAVAAGIFLAGLATLLPAVKKSQSALDQAVCNYNLKQIGLGLTQYAAINRHYPEPPKGYPAGHYSLELSEKGLLGDTSVLVCPCSAVTIDHLPDCDEFDALMARSPRACQEMLGEQYAYNILPHDAVPAAGGRLAAAVAGRMPVPLLADEPPRDDLLRVLDGNSPNHGGGGQYVLFDDLSVRWLRSRSFPALKDTDIYLNRDRKAAPGLNQADVSLIPAGFRVQ